MIEDTLARHFHAAALPAGHPVREAIDELRRLRAERDALLASAPKWILCSERMPDDDIEVLAWNGHAVIAACCGEWFVTDELLTVEGVTHWLDLPAAPEEAK